MEAPVTEDYMESDNGFAGKIVKVTISIQDMKPVDKARGKKSRRSSARIRRPRISS
jgi:hypothetical protein